MERQDVRSQQILQAGLYLIELIRAALRDEKAKEKPETILWEQVYRLAKRNSVESISAYGVGTLKEKPPREIWDKWKEAPKLVAHRVLHFDWEREQILAQMKGAGLSYLPLKGILLAGYYPKDGMRTMADNDILYGFVEENISGGFKIKGGTKDEQAAAVALATREMTQIMEKRGYEMVCAGEIHDSYHKLPFFNLEMHRKMIKDEYDPFAYYENPWKRAIQDADDPNAYHFSDEDEFIYFFFHAYKHFSNGGCGIRLLTDAYVFLERKGRSLNWDYMKKELETATLAEFAEKVCGAAKTVFGEGAGELCTEDQNLVLYLLTAGTYGTIDNQVFHELRKISGDTEPGRAVKLKYVWKRLFPDDEWWRVWQPLGYKYPVLRPFITIYRIVRSLFKRPRVIKEEMKALKKI